MPAIDKVTIVLWLILPICALIAWARTPIKRDVPDPMAEPHGDMPTLPWKDER